MNSDRTANIDDFGMDTISLAGTLPAKLAGDRATRASRRSCCRRATSSATPTASTPRCAPCATAACASPASRCCAISKGCPATCTTTRSTSRSRCSRCAPRSAPKVLLVCSSTSTHATADPDVLARDLRKLAMLAVPLGIQRRVRRPVVGPHDQRVPDGLGHRVPRRCAQPRHRHRLVPRLRDQDLARRPRHAVDPDKIFLVQLADFMWQEIRIGRGAHRDRAPLPRVPRRRRAQRGAGRAGDAARRAGLSRRLQLRGLQRRLPADAAADGRRARAALRRSGSARTCCAARCRCPGA